SSVASVEIDSIIPSTNQTINSPITGVLYDRGLSCVADPPEALPGLSSAYNQNKIALIQAGNCSFLNKVLLAQNDSALAAIIFINGKFDADTSSLMDIPPVGQSGVNIPTYLVQGQDGMNMYNTLKTYEHSNASIGNNVTKSRALRVTMYPASGAFPSAWEFTLIIVVALLAVSFILSVFLHWHLWRVRRRQRIMLENNIALPTVTSTIPQNKTVIDPSQLDIFPARIIGDEDESDLPVPENIPTEEEKQLSRRPSLQSIRSTKSTRSSHALQNAEALATCSQGDLPMVAQVLIKQAENAESDTTEAEVSDKADTAAGEANDAEKQVTAAPGQEVLSATNIAQSQSDATCVICLDDFDVGEKVRQLPCRHEFHCECIDPWLTIKSASCPLCKMDCSLSIPRTAANESTQQAPQPPPPAATTSGSRFQSFFSMSPSTSPSSFGPTITADNAANFSNSWMARSLPRNMRRQLEAASAAINGPTIELPARMTGNPQPTQSQDLEANNQSASQGTLPNRMARTLPRYWRTRE
ncbi:hypothetical protein INT43_006853, partial [Umbelopsis isabellina]